MGHKSSVKHENHLREREARGGRGDREGGGEGEEERKGKRERDLTI